MATENCTGDKRPIDSPIERRLKACKSYHEYQLSQSVLSRTPVPQILLKGHWLHRAGFEVDTPVRVRVMHGCLVLTAE